MSYNKLNKLERDLRVVEIVERHYIAGVTTYAGVWREYVQKVYPMCYNTFMCIMRTPNLRKMIEVEKKQAEREEVRHGQR